MPASRPAPDPEPVATRIGGFPPSLYALIAVAADMADRIIAEREAATALPADMQAGGTKLRETGKEAPREVGIGP